MIGLLLVLAATLVPPPEFWYAVALASAGKLEPARPLFAQAFAADPRWRELVKRLPDVNQLPSDPQLLAAILAIR